MLELEDIHWRAESRDILSSVHLQIRRGQLMHT